jgi:ribosomal 50S subunit-recycling heat shock protein
MRLDKFLKVSRIIKRRTVAKEACDQERVSVNDLIAKASDKVAVGDRISIEFGHRIHSYEVRDVKEYVKKDEAKEMYVILGE